VRDRVIFGSWLSRHFSHYSIDMPAVRPAFHTITFVRSIGAQITECDQKSIATSDLVSHVFLLCTTNFPELLIETLTNAFSAGFCGDEPPRPRRSRQ
jgi:hypothetical protein